MGRRNQVFPRDCFACGKPMVESLVNSEFLECRECDIWEDGTVKGRFTLQPIPFAWENGDYIPFVDHSKVHLSSPDVTGGV